MLIQIILCFYAHKTVFFRFFHVQYRWKFMKIFVCSRRWNSCYKTPTKFFHSRMILNVLKTLFYIKHKNSAFFIHVNSWSYDDCYFYFDFTVQLEFPKKKRSNFICSCIFFNEFQSGLIWYRFLCSHTNCRQFVDNSRFHLLFCFYSHALF